MTRLSGMSTGASKLQMYKIMQTQLDTIRIHIATSDRPMYTSSSWFGSESVLMTFLSSCETMNCDTMKRKEQKRTSP